ncbi:MAG: hypothetical protein ACJAZ8_001152 [Planctomycetota bacterium]|jgi:hypothetical protein
MEFETWVQFWKFTLYGGLGLFAILSVWVIYAGVGDIRDMFASLTAERDRAEEDRKDES